MKRWIYASVAILCAVGVLACGFAIAMSYANPSPTPKRAPFLVDGEMGAGLDHGSVWVVQTVISAQRRPAPWRCSMALLQLEAYTMTAAGRTNFDVRTASLSLWAVAAA